MQRTVFTTLLALLVATSAFAAHRAPQRRAIGGHLEHRRGPAPRPARHDYLRTNATLAARNAERRGAQGHATYYHPATEGESAVGSCGGKPMTDSTMGVALSSPGWKYFASQGISQQDLCFKDITIKGILGSQKAQIMDECPESPSTKTCLNICDIDLTYGLFGMLAQHVLGIFPVSWSFDDGTASPCGKGGAVASSSSSPSSSSSSSAPVKPTAAPSPADDFKSNVEHFGSAVASAASAAVSHVEEEVKQLFETSLQWWDDIDPQWCPNLTPAKGAITAAVGPTQDFPNDKLQDTCGKWISIVSGGKTTKAQVVEWIPDTVENFLAVGTAFQNITESGSPQVKWGFHRH